MFTGPVEGFFLLKGVSSVIVACWGGQTLGFWVNTDTGETQRTGEGGAHVKTETGRDRSQNQSPPVWRIQAHSCSVLLLPDRADGVEWDQGQMAVGSGGPQQRDSALLYLLSSSFFLSRSLSLHLPCCFHHCTLFKDNLKSLPSGASAQVYFEIHHVSSCGFSTGTIRVEVMGVLGQRNAVIMSALIPEEAGIHVRHTNNPPVSSL